jgi:N-methylhydantoinase A
MLEATNTVVSDQQRAIYDPVARATVSAAVIERSSLSPGDAVMGAAIIVESQTTTVLGSHHRAVVQSDDSLLITRIAEGTTA